MVGSVALNERLVRKIQLSGANSSEKSVKKMHSLYRILDGAFMESEISNKSEFSESEKSVGDCISIRCSDSRMIMLSYVFARKLVNAVWPIAAWDAGDFPGFRKHTTIAFFQSSGIVPVSHILVNSRGSTSADALDTYASIM